MNKIEFLDELRYKLRQLPQAEIESAMNYYEEYFNDAGAQYEQRVIQELGSPSAVAAKLIGEYAVSDAEAHKGKGLSPFLVLFLAICASPVAIPLAIGLFVLIVSLFIVFLAFGISGAALAFSGIVSILVGLWAAITSFPTGLFYIGFGLFAASVGISIIIGTAKLSTSVFFGLQKILGRLLIRRGAK